jgi:hypothetical protein
MNRWTAVQIYYSQAHVMCVHAAQSGCHSPVNFHCALLELHTLSVKIVKAHVVCSAVVAASSGSHSGIDCNAMLSDATSAWHLTELRYSLLVVSCAALLC